MSECTMECQAVKDAAAVMGVDELEAELEASGRFTDSRALAEYLVSGAEAEADGEEEDSSEEELDEVEE